MQRNRISRLQKLMEEENIDAVHFQGENDLRYFTGHSMTAGTLFVTRKRAALFVDDRYFDRLKKEASIAVKRLSEKEIAKFLKSVKPEIKCVVLNDVILSHREYKQVSSLLKRIKKEIKILSTPSLFHTRLVKDAKELATMRKAAKLTIQGINHIQGLLELGITEKELAVEFELFVLENGADGLSFPPIVAFGPNSAYPHYRPGNVRLKKSDAVVLFDVGIMMDGYASDLTRYHFLPSHKKAHLKVAAAVQEAHDAVMKALKPGTPICDLNHIANESIIKNGYKDYIRHSIGHFVGMDVHEGYHFYSAKKETLEEGMVITVEPGIYLPGELGIRLENMFVITKTGAKSLVNISSNK